MAEIEIKNVVKRFGRTTAVDDVSIEIADGEFLVLVGPSGCGKTTTLRMVAGLERITSGEITVAGQRVNQLAPKDRDLAMVFQSYALYSHLDVRGNLGFALKASGAPKAEIAAKIDRVANMLGLEDLLDRKPKMMSGGQRQRVALGRAIIREPQAFLMDEPLSNLDAMLRLQTRKDIIELTRDLNSTVLYVTHDQTEAMTMGHRMAVMKDGRVQQLDTPANVYSRPSNLFVARFIGQNPMNLLEMEVVGDNGVTELRNEFLRLPLRAGLRHPGPVTVGIRPEDLELTTDEDGVAAVASVVEMLGAELLVYAEVGRTNLSFIAPARTGLRAGDQVRLRFPEERLHLFDTSSGQRLEAAAELGAASA